MFVKIIKLIAADEFAMSFLLAFAVRQGSLSFIHYPRMFDPQGRTWEYNPLY